MAHFHLVDGPPLASHYQWALVRELQDRGHIVALFNISQVLRALRLGLFGETTSGSDFTVADPRWTFGGPLSPEADTFLTASNTEFNEKQKVFQSVSTRLPAAA